VTTKAAAAQRKRDKRSKVILAVLGVLLLVVLALQLPKLMHSGGSSPTAAAALTDTTGTPVLASSPPPASLTRFTRFAAKDPFRARVTAPSDAQSQTGATSTNAAATKPAPTPKPKQPVASPLTISVTQAALPAGPRVPAALLTIDGKRTVVPLDAEFPAKHPLFRVMALSQKAIWIQLVGGSFASGKQTLKLDRGRRITLVDDTAGLKMVLVLVKPTTAPKPVAVPATTTTTPATTPATTTATGK
jgi:hypothetical protein